MSITIVFISTSPKFNATNERHWSIGTPKPEIDPNGIVKVLKASGEELEHINRIFENIPTVIGNYAIWRQPYAQFIWDNL